VGVCGGTNKEPASRLRSMISFGAAGLTFTVRDPRDNSIQMKINDVFKSYRREAQAQIYRYRHPSHWVSEMFLVI
jgi:hypothetical protein